MNRLTNKHEIYKMLLDAVPPRPYATDYPIRRGLYRTSKSNALECDLIQLNGSNRCSVIIFDIDYDIALCSNLEHMPIPNIVMVNPANKHSHIGYVLANPVPLYDWTPASQRLLLKVVQDGLTAGWEADSGYAHLISKNPFSDRWLTYVMREDPYSLVELRRYVDDDLAQSIAHPKAVSALTSREAYKALGRNCSLFEDVRHWAYKEVHKHGDYEGFLQAVHWYACDLNIGNLEDNEVFCISKSIARWTFDHLTKDKSKENMMAWNKVTARKSIAVRKAKKEERIEAFARLYVPNESSIAEVCKVLGISLSSGKSYVRELRARQEAYQPELPNIEPSTEEE